ncbi:MAG: FAD-binding protein, partial [Acidobacteria bacterium]|nr:FAD-binding protein [Acidobacteriota bacterium]
MIGEGIPRADLVRELARALGAEQVVSDPAELLTYERDGGLDRGMPDLVVLPRTTAEVQAVVRLACRARLPVVARGAGTGLAGGAVADRGGVVMSLARMDDVRIDASSRTAECQPGAVNQGLADRALAAGLYFPPDPSSGRTATIGGNVGTGAGGPHCFKYGVMTNYVTGLEVVINDGRAVWFGGHAADCPEYDFVAVLTGSEGTLGVVTTVRARLIRRPPGTRTLMAAFDSVEQAGNAVSAVIAAGLVPSTLEMMDRRVMRMIEDYVDAGLPVDAEAALIVDVDGYTAGLDAQLDEIRAVLERHGGRDLRLARSDAERDRIWYGRKSAAGAMTRLAPAYSLVDVTVPRSRLAEMLAEVNTVCER